MDVSALQPEARPIAEAVARVYMQHTGHLFVGLAVHGSAFKGDFIPGCSDIDFQLYLRREAFDAEGNISLSLALAIHRDLARIDPAPFSSVQCLALAIPFVQAERPDVLPPLPGTYHVVAGVFPLPHPTREEAVRSAHAALGRLRAVPAKLPNDLLDFNAARLPRWVRLICTDVWPALYHLLIVRGHDPLDVWRLPKRRAIALLPERDDTGAAIRAFHAAVLAYYVGGPTVEGGLGVLEAGVGFLRAVKKEYERIEVRRLHE